MTGTAKYPQALNGVSPLWSHIGHFLGGFAVGLIFHYPDGNVFLRHEAGSSERRGGEPAVWRGVQGVVEWTLPTRRRR